MKLNLEKNSFDFSANFWIFLFVVENKETLKHLASLYANNHPSMHMGQPSCPNKSGRYFPYALLLLLLFGERRRTCLIWSYWPYNSQCFYRWEYSRRSNAWSRMAQSPGQHEGMFIEYSENGIVNTYCTWSERIGGFSDTVKWMNSAQYSLIT